MAWSGSALALVLPLLAGCGAAVTETYIHDPPPSMVPREPPAVLVYASKPPTRPHLELAMLEAKHEQGLDSSGVDLLVHRLRTRAAQLGCDAIVIGGIRERGAHGYALLTPGTSSLHGTCIVFMNDSTSASGARPSGGECPCHAR